MRHFFIAGFDFGTSYSKVVLRDQLTGVAKVVTFGTGRGGLLPSFVSVAKNSVIGPDGEREKLTLHYPKLIAADVAARKSDFSSLYGDSLETVQKLIGTTSLEQVARVSLIRFFLTVLDSIHHFISRDQEWNMFDPETDPLVVQLAVPTGLTAADGKTDAIMQRSLAAATLIRRKQKKALPVSSIAELTAAWSTLEGLDPGTREDLNARCITYPEVAAGVQTVFRSPNTPDGKYLTLDVGAGTVDLNAFYRRSGGRIDNRGLDYWACEVRPLGFARLDLGKTKQSEALHEVTVNPLQEAELLKRLKTAVGELMRGAFRYQPYKIHGSGGSPWHADTIAYIWGGGADSPALRGNLSVCGSIARNSSSCDQPAPSPRRPASPSKVCGLRAPRRRLRLVVSQGELGASPSTASAQDFRRPLPRLLAGYDSCHKAVHVPRQSDVLPVPRKRLYFPGHKIAPLLGISLFQPTHRVVPTPPPKTRARTALEHCLGQFDLMVQRQDRALLIERLLLLNRIRLLCSRPEFREDDPLCDQARHALLYNVRLFGGKVRVRRFSAKRMLNGCLCLVIRRAPGPPADVEIHSRNPVELESCVNRDLSLGHVDLGCGIQRTDRKEFVLELSSLNPGGGNRRPTRQDQRQHRYHA